MILPSQNDYCSFYFPGKTPRPILFRRLSVMKKRLIALLAALTLVLTLLVACNAPADDNTQNSAITPAVYDYDKDFSVYRTAGQQEESYDYKLNFLPAVDGLNQPYVGDTMPYYENGTYYIYYLKEGGDSYNHSIYVATTTDFKTYTEYDAPVLESSRSGGQDAWIGTGSLVKVEDKYYFFYTGHAASSTLEYAEKVMVAEGTSPLQLTKREGWDITPPATLGQKQDFRDPQAYYNGATDTIEMTVTASQSGKARILKYTLSKDLTGRQYDGIIFTDENEGFWNLECSDTFRMGNKYYITYSGQDDTLWYAFSDTAYGPYGSPKRLDDKLFYAAKHVSDGTNMYMVGWLRRSASASSLSEVAEWGGNLAVQQLGQNADGSLYLKPAEVIASAFTDKRTLLSDTSVSLEGGLYYEYQSAFTAYERFLIKGKFNYTGSAAFGLAFDYSGKQEKYKLVSVIPSEKKMTLSFNEGENFITETAVTLKAGETYLFTYLQEGSCGVFYIDGIAALSVRLYGVSGRQIRLFVEKGSVEFTDLVQYTAA